MREPYLFGSSQNIFGTVYYTRFHDVYGAKETHLKTTRLRGGIIYTTLSEHTRVIGAKTCWDPRIILDSVMFMV